MSHDLHTGPLVLCTAVEITVLGKSPAMPDSDGANSGYMVTEDGFTLLLDCGTGVFAKLRTVCEPTAVDVILITHMHVDHFADLLPYAHALAYPYAKSGARPLLLLPPHGRELLAQIVELLGIGYPVVGAFEVEEYDPDAVHAVGPFTVRHREVPHYIRTWACELSAPQGGRFTFGADCAPNDALVDFARDTDFLMLEATDEVAPFVPEGDVRGHMTAREAGELARRAGAKCAALTHFSDLLDPEVVASEGAAGFGEPVVLVQAGARFTV
jgi:ribonuclease BN (tRNA processing enzyme)